MYKWFLLRCALTGARWLACCGTGVFAISLAIAAETDDTLPPRSQWHASSSSIEVPAMAPTFAIDGDEKTRWGGGFSAGQWFQVDLGRAAAVGGVLIRWDSGFAHHYSIQSSTDARRWQTAFETNDASGGSDYVFFSPVRARYLRIVSPSRTADWGVSIFEFEPLAASAAPRLSGLAKKTNTSTLWNGNAPRELAVGKGQRASELNIELPRPLPVSGLEILWGTRPHAAKLEARDTAGIWTVLANDPEEPGRSSYLAARTAATISALRLTVQGDDKAVSVRHMRLLGPTQAMTAMKRYEIAASRAHSDLFPSSLHWQQVYWTAVGIPAGRQKSVFDEYGDVEAFKGAPLVQPMWRDASGRTAAAFDKKLTHSLRAGWMPMPAVQWQAQSGLQVRSEAIAIEQAGAPVTVVRHRLQNTGKTSIQGDFSLIVRPIQISPPWQNAGPSPIYDVTVEGSSAQSVVRINGRVLLHSLTNVDTRGAAGFGNYGEGEITKAAVSGVAPKTSVAHDDDGLAAALLSYRVELPPGAHRDIVIALPLGNERIDVNEKILPPSPPVDRAQLIGANVEPGAGFDALADRLAQQWQDRLGKIGLSLPDHSLVDMLRAQAAYMLINQTGPAMQPGPRNYNRSFIRDGSATAVALLRMGMAQTSRDYLRWYADHAVHENGLVSPILNDDGTVNTGFGSDIEHDSQGEFIWLIGEIARLDGGAATVREYQPIVKRALQFLEQLRERTLVPGYMSDREAPERFRGILAPSISHEGYSTPTHSYWDDYWGLKAWHDGAWLADEWGDREMARWAREQYSLLRDSLAASIRATMKWKGIDFIPAAADLGDGDPTSVSIGLDPCGQQDILPADALRRTFERYLEDVRKRDTPNALYAYTPYEMRNVLTYVHLNEPQHADELLNNLLRHRRPLEWQVLAEVVYSDLRHAIYLGDMPHTWIGSEYARSLFGMLMHEADDRLQLLPGTPTSWLAGEGLSVNELPTAFGKLSLQARQQGTTLRLTLGTGLRANTALQVSWPSRRKPTRVIVDGKTVTDYTNDGIELARPFKELEAQW